MSDGGQIQWIEKEDSFLYDGVCTQQEGDITFLRAEEIAEITDISRVCFDFEYLRFLHRHLFQDISGFAGALRKYDIKKENSIFTPWKKIEFYADQIFFEIREKSHQIGTYNEKELISFLSEYLGKINILHPFPEGNGRTQRIFISFLAQKAGYFLDWTKVHSWEINQTSKNVFEGDYDSMGRLLFRILTPLPLTSVIIGLGSSEGDKKEYLQSACMEMKELGENFRVSSFLETQAEGGVAKNTFLNAVATFDTDLSPIELLDSLQAIETKYGRIRKKRWDDRTLDLDILYYGDETIQTDRLTVPHPRIAERDFVTKPLLELFPDFNIHKDISG